MSNAVVLTFLLGLGGYWLFRAWATAILIGFQIAARGREARTVRLFLACVWEWPVLWYDPATIRWEEWSR